MRNKYYALALGVTFLGSLTLGAQETEDRTIRFAEGVTTEKGWYDVNKVGRGENGDINMCWAAAASNILQWWQDRYIEAGNTLPEGLFRDRVQPMIWRLWMYSIRNGTI